jgi:6-phosphogluconate dehydrogenase
MGQYLGMTNEEMGNTFEEWNHGDLDSYLIEVNFIKI